MSKIWYTVEIPRDKPCWEVNPRLWAHFCGLHGVAKSLENELYTEQYVVQAMDEIDARMRESHEIRDSSCSSHAHPSRG